ncbi:C39 family peptidase [Acutalibacter caecimuris]|uniref:C39 family peptidase n=1 Tax=Acutalibacter caecimuris TaxID=3093657 RepID=UPI002AC933D8|nr:C39 family peptidase [Acutalibacter sp. M00118]
MRYPTDTLTNTGGTRRKRMGRPVLLTLVLAALCIGGMELAFCRFYSPALFYRVTGPVVRPFIAAAEAVQNQVALWRFQYARDTLAARVATQLGGYLSPRPVLFPAPYQPVDLPEPEEPAPPAVTEFQQIGGHTVLTGGLPCIYYNQGDAAWKDKPFGSDPIGPYGCGPTVMAMVVSSMTDQAMDPAQMAVWAYEHDYWCAGSGSYLTIVEGTAKAFGLQGSLRKQCDLQALKSQLDGGGIAVALMGPGHFTDVGHFIIIHGMAPDGRLLIADPASRERSLALWDPALILKEATREGEGVRMWFISPPGEAG